MKPYQKMNRFPGMNMISLKSNMALNLRKMKKYYPHDYDFFP